MGAQTRVHAMGESAFAAAARAIDAHLGQTPTQAVREFRGLTQSDLAKRSGVSVGTISALENGESPDTLLLDAVAAALEVPKSLLKR
jgi:DNA-binding XRE family transcriptional regulator